MSEANGTTKTPPTLAEMREQIQRNHLEVKLRKSKKLLEMWGDAWGDDAFGGSDTVLKLRFADPSGQLGWLPHSIPSDRRHGANWPLWRTLIELDRLRQWSRVLVDSNGFAEGLLNNLTNFTIGKGFTYKCQVKSGVGGGGVSNKAGAAVSEAPSGSKSQNETLIDKPAKPPADPSTIDPMQAIADQCQEFVDEFLKLNRWNGQVDPLGEVSIVTGTREREIFRRVKRDGECFVRFHFLEEGITQIRFVEPEQVRDGGPGQTAREGWSYGIQHQMQPHEDVETPIGYWVAWQDAAATGGEEDPKNNGERIDAKEILHLRGANTDASVKRGMPLFRWDTAASLYRAAKLQDNLSKGAAYRAATGEIWQYATATQAQLAAMQGTLAQFTKTDPFTGQPEFQERQKAPAIRRVPAGSELVGQPADNTPAYMEGVGGDLRAAGASSCAPEYWFGDASNADYSSTKEASAPAVKMGECEQEYYKMAFLCVVWRAVKWAVECEKLPIQVLDSIDIQVDGPTVLHQDPLEVTQKNQILNQAKVKSPQTWAADEGLDYELEAANFEEHESRFPPMDELGLPGDEGDTIGADKKPVKIGNLPQGEQ